MSTAYGIDSGAIRSHASTVTSVAAGASAAGAAAISHLADAVDELAQDLRTMASGYETNEQVTSSGYARAKKDFSTILGPADERQHAPRGSGGHRDRDLWHGAG